MQSKLGEFFLKQKNAHGKPWAFIGKILLFDDLQDFHGAGLDTNAASDALGNRRLFLMYHDLHGAGLHTSAAANAQLLVDHVNAGLGVLGNSTMLTGLHALAAGDAGHRLCAGALGNDLDAAEIGIKFLIESFGAGLDALQASHTFGTLFNSELLHNGKLSFIFNLSFILYMVHLENATVNIDIIEPIRVSFLWRILAV